MAARAGAVDGFGAGRTAVGRADPEERALRLERGEHGRVVDVGLRAAVAGLATDADLDEVLAGEATPHGRHRGEDDLAEAPRARSLAPEKGDLVGEGGGQADLVVH